ncbi:MAG: PAS domain S-box protein, partial [Myxococcales bacterium]
RISRAVLEVGEALAGDLDHDKIVQRLTDVTTRLVGAQFGAFFWNGLTPSGESFLLYTLSGAPREAFSKFPAPRATALFGPTFRGEGIIRIADVRADPRFGKSAPYHGMPKGHLPVVSYLAAPVRGRDGSVLGGLFFGHSDAGVFGEAEERILEGATAHAAVAIENSRLYQKSVAAEQSLAQQLAFNTALTDSLGEGVIAVDLEKRIIRVNPAAQRILGVGDEIVGRTLEEALPFRYLDGSRAERPLVRALASNSAVRGRDGVYRRANGEDIEVAYNAAPIHQNGQLQGAILTFIDITDERRAAERLRLSEERFRALYEQSSIGIVVKDVDGRVRDANPALCRMLGRTAAEIVGRGFEELSVAEDVVRERALFAELLSQKRGMYQLEKRYVRADGSVVWASLTFNAVRNQNGDVLFVVVMVEDISDRRRAMEALAHSEERLRLALEAGQMGSWEFDVRAGRVRWSATLERIHGIPEGTFDGTFEGYQRDIHPEDRGWVLEHIAASSRGERPHHLKYRIVRPDGEVRWLEAYGQLVRNEAGEPVRIVGVCSDVTDRIRAEQDQRRLAREQVAREYAEAAQKDIEALLSSIKDPFSAYDAEFRVRFVNEAALAAAKMSREEVVGHSVWELFPELKGSRFEEMYRSVRDDKRPRSFEYRVEALGRWFELSVYPFGEGISTYARDVTERREAQEEIRRKEELLSEAQSLAHVGNWEYLLDGNRATWSDEMYRIYGFEPSDPSVTFEQLGKMLHPDDRERVEKLMNETFAAGGSCAFEHRIVRRDGSIRWLTDRVRAVYENGKPVRVVGT